MKKLLCLFICLFVITNVQALELNSKYAVLYNLNDNKIVNDLNKDEKTSIAALIVLVP